MTLSPARHSRPSEDSLLPLPAEDSLLPLPAGDALLPRPAGEDARPIRRRRRHQPLPDGPAAPPAALPDLVPDPVPPSEAGVSPARHAAPLPVAELLERLPVDEVVDEADVDGEIAALGLDDESARARYGMSLHRVRRSVLEHARARRTPGLRRAPHSRPYLLAAAQRCALYLGPLGVATAAARPLGAVGWLIPVAVLVLGWSTAQAMTSLGASVARSAGTAAAARLVAGGFGAAAGLWCAAVWVTPSAWLGTGRMLALVIGVLGLAALSTVTAALVTRAQPGVILWSVPCWVLGVAAIALPAQATPLVETLLPAAIVVAAVRAYRPVIGCPVPRRRRLAPGDVRRAVGYLIAGAAQAISVALVWRAGDTAATAAAAIPLLLAVPALEALVGWHLHQIEAGLDAAESERDYRRHVRSVAVATVAALLPPLVAGIGLAAVAYRVPADLVPRDGVLALAAGTLLGGLFAATFLLAARGRTGTAATVAAAAPLAIVALPWLAPLAPLPTVVAVLAGALLLGLLTVAHIAADHRRPL